jgi:hypothetical protein
VVRGNGDEPSGCGTSQPGIRARAGLLKDFPMAEASHIRLRFERFAETGAKHAFQLRSGREFLGWAMDIREEAVLVSWAPSPFYAQATDTDEMAPPDEWIPFTDIVPSSLSYWDDMARRWVSFLDAEPGAAPDPAGV